MMITFERKSLTVLFATDIVTKYEFTWQMKQ